MIDDRENEEIEASVLALGTAFAATLVAMILWLAS